jgi:signal transduction histidine kinase
MRSSTNPERPAAPAIDASDAAALVDHVLDAGDRERARTAHRLHDGPQQTMTAVRLMADVVRQALRDGDLAGARGVLDELDRHAASAADEVRREIARMHPVVLEQQGLVQALAAFAESVSEDGMRTTFSGPAERLPADRARDAHLLQMAREAAAFAVRLCAPPIEIALTVGDDGAVRLTLEGGAVRGNGFERDARDRAAQIIARRAARLGAHAELVCRPGQRLRFVAVVHGPSSA